MCGSKVVGAAVLGVTEATSSTDNGLSKGSSFALLSVFFRKGKWFPMFAKLKQKVGGTIREIPIERHTSGGSRGDSPIPDPARCKRSPPTQASCLLILDLPVDSRGRFEYRF